MTEEAPVTFNAEERDLIRRLRRHRTIYVASPDRMRALRRLEALGLCAIHAGTGLDNGLLVGRITKDPGFLATVIAENRDQIAQRFAEHVARIFTTAKRK